MKTPLTIPDSILAALQESRRFSWLPHVSMQTRLQSITFAEATRRIHNRRATDKNRSTLRKRKVSQ